ncbi:MAG: hypothetical protein JSU85_08660 [Candidatus Zixiibacteriota bacterium]|nr:MAG: hypothetical protein JSU85_08660 [candidate division Zixibacteria bacterium]
MDLKIIFNKKAFKIAYFILSIILFMVGLSWFIIEYEYSKSPIAFIALRIGSISKADSISFGGTRIYIPVNSIITESDLQENLLEVKFIYEYKYVLTCLLMDNVHPDYYTDTFYNFIENISFGDLTGRSYHFKFNSDDVYILYEIADMNTEDGNHYAVNAFLPDKKLVLFISGIDLDVMKTINVIREIVYNDVEKGISLVGEKRKEDKL